MICSTLHLVRSDLPGNLVARSHIERCSGAAVLACCSWRVLLSRSVAPGLLLKGLAVVLPAPLLQHPKQQQQDALNGLPRRSLSASVLAELRTAALAELSDGSVPQGKQDVPVDTATAAPLYWPTEKVGCR